MNVETMDVEIPAAHAHSIGNAHLERVNAEAVQNVMALASTFKVMRITAVDATTAVLRPPLFVETEPAKRPAFLIVQERHVVATDVLDHVALAKVISNAMKFRINVFARMDRPHVARGASTPS